MQGYSLPGPVIRLQKEDNPPLLSEASPLHWATPKPPSRLRNRSKYNPHQNVRERMRRVGQLIRQGQAEPTTLYVVYSTARAGKQNLAQFSDPWFYQCNGPQEQGLLKPGPDIRIIDGEAG
jgi:hypothetical protein